MAVDPEYDSALGAGQGFLRALRQLLDTRNIVEAHLYQGGCSLNASAHQEGNRSLARMLKPDVFPGLVGLPEITMVVEVNSDPPGPVGVAIIGFLGTRVARGGQKEPVG